jgi:hypothetical protein
MDGFYSLKISLECGLPTMYLSILARPGQFWFVKMILEMEQGTTISEAELFKFYKVISHMEMLENHRKRIEILWARKFLRHMASLESLKIQKAKEDDDEMKNSLWRQHMNDVIEGLLDGDD